MDEVKEQLNREGWGSSKRDSCMRHYREHGFCFLSLQDRGQEMREAIRRSKFSRSGRGLELSLVLIGFVKLYQLRL